MKIYQRKTINLSNIKKNNHLFNKSFLFLQKFIFFSYKVKKKLISIKKNLKKKTCRFSYKSSTTHTITL